MTLAQEWFSAAEFSAMALPGIPTTHAKVLEMARAKGWSDPTQEGKLWRRRAASGGGVEFHYAVLWAPAQSVLVAKLGAAPEAAPGSSPGAGSRPLHGRDERWEWFERQPAAKRGRAAARLAALDTVRTLQRGGIGRVHAMTQVSLSSGVTLSTLYGWEARVIGIPRPDWLAFLADGWGGAADRRDCPDEAWDVLRADYLRPEKPSFAACHRRLEKVARVKGWALPSARTLQRRIEEIPEAVQVFARQGVEALKRLYPAQERSRAHFHALEAINADGHKWDVFVRWPDGEIVRPMMVAFQDLYSGKMLSWRIDKSENREATRLAFGDLVDAFGIPDRCWFDNGRAFASKWITGGTANRYRFKVRDEEPLGLLTQLGVEIHWTNPYAGQSKPIERAFRDFAGDTAKHPKFAGAYVGNSPLAKPENYGAKAIPLDVFLEVVGEGVAEHNARTGRDTAVCAGRSFDQAFDESYATAPIRKASAAQRRLWLLAAENLLCARNDGSIRLEGNRFWGEFLTGLRGSRVTVRFDPQALQDDLAVYALDGKFLGTAPCLEAVGFDNVEAAQAHNRARHAWMRGQKMQVAAERKLSIEQVAAMLPSETPSMAPQSKVVRPVFGNLALKPRSDDLPEQSEAEIRFLRAVGSNVQAIRRLRDEQG